MKLILLFLYIVLVNNVITSQFLGICPFLGVSKKTDTAIGMGVAVTFVIALASIITYFIQIILDNYQLGYLQTIAFILVIASIVQFVEMVIKKTSPSLYQALGVFLPLITTNCAVLGIAIVNITKGYNIIETLVNGIGAGIVYAVVVLGILGLIFGIILDFASKKFAVEVDPKEAEVLEVLPGANCGGCGFPGCGGLAAAIAKGEAPVNGCPVGGAAVAEKVAAIMGVEAGAGEKIVANVRCKGTCDATKEKYEYSGIQDCRAAASLIGGAKSCSYGCLGLGTCVQVCNFDAIHVVDGVAVVDEEKCVNCGKCIDICPKALIERKPANKAVTVQCKSNDFGKTVKDNCTVGCIGCGICFKECPFDAIIFEDKLARIDYEKCKQCNKCAMKCPTKVIKPKERKKPVVKAQPKPQEPKVEEAKAEVKPEENN